MEQIYYTQCPMGYGLGASNGFQVKRIGAGYPPSGDVRHLALRAFLPGSNGKVLAPGTLRYRRLGSFAEVAWLEPRAREYETERGQWGRPGGHFAHGLRLDPEELAALSNWPAGLFGRPFWRHSDPEPSRGRRPEELSIGPDDLLVPPDVGHVASRIDLDADRLALLLSAAAEAVRSGRALFLIDEPERLGPRIAAITFAFPDVFRAELTFSTYHDRPEELSGFRIHGVAPSSTLNRTVLAGLGPIVDLGADRLDPGSPPPEWASTLATWLTRRQPGDLESWTRTNARARMARRPDDAATLWSDSWLDGLLGMEEAVRADLAPDSESAWSRFARQAAWASASGLARELAGARGPHWWRPLIRQAVPQRPAHEAFWSIVLAPEIWDEQGARDSADWGRCAAPFWMRYRSPQREKTLNDALRRIGSVDTLSRFLDGLIRSVPDESGQSALRWLERRGGLDPMVLLPLKARVAVNLMRSQGSEDALRDVLDHASRSPDTLLTVLDLIADEAGEHRDEVPVSLLVERLEPEALSRFERWALRRAAGGGGDWLSPALRRLFASESERPEWEALRDRTPEGLWPVLAPLCLEAASAPGSTPGAFHWAVEDLLLRIPEPDRPWSPSWVEHLLLLIGSPYDLAARIRSRGDRLQRWLDLGRADGRLNGRLLDLLDDANSLALLIDGQAEIPDDALLSRLPPRDRGAVLELMIDRLASGQFEPSEPILVRCAGHWPGAFDDGPEQRDALAGPIAGLLLQFVPDPELWIDAMVRVRRWLGLDRRGDSTWPPEGIAAAILTETCRRSADPSATWELRSALLRVDRAYRALCLDLSMELRSQQVRASVDVARRWDRSLDKGTHSDRFFEILLNACDGPRLAEVVPEFAGDLRTLGDLPWWAGDREGNRPDDLRVAFMMLVPMAPLASPRCLNPVEGWLFRQGPGRPFSSVRDDPHELLIVDDGQSGPDPSRSSAMTRPPDRAISRWSCLRALTEFHWEGKTTEGRWADLAGWRKSGTGGTAPPIASLEPGDQYDFLASLILALDHPGADSYEVEALARWVVKGLGLHSRSRLLNCIEAIASRGVEVPPGRRRLARDLAHQMGQQLDD